MTLPKRFQNETLAELFPDDPPRMTLPKCFQNQEFYDAWIQEQAEAETDELLDQLDPEEIHKDNIDIFVRESGRFAHDRVELARLYHDVKKYSYRADATSPQSLGLNLRDWFAAPYECMSMLVSEWLTSDTADFVQIEVESRGYPTGEETDI